MKKPSLKTCITDSFNPKELPRLVINIYSPDNGFQNKRKSNGDHS